MSKENGTDVKSPATKKVVGNKQTESIIGSAARSLSQSLDKLHEVTKALSNIDDVVNDKVLRIGTLEDTLEELQVKVRQKTEQNRIELQNQYDADAAAFTARFLTSKNLTAVDTAEYTKLNTQLQEAVLTKDRAVEEAVASAVKTEQEKARTAESLLNAEHARKEADNKAQITQLLSQVDFLTKQVDLWKTALDSERAASIERAKASSVGSINVTPSK